VLRAAEVLQEAPAAAANDAVPTAPVAPHAIAQA